MNPIWIKYDSQPSPLPPGRRHQAIRTPAPGHLAHRLPRRQRHRCAAARRQQAGGVVHHVLRRQVPEGEPWRSVKGKGNYKEWKYSEYECDEAIICYYYVQIMCCDYSCCH